MTILQAVRSSSKTAVFVVTMALFVDMMIYGLAVPSHHLASWHTPFSCQHSGQEVLTLLTYVVIMSIHYGDDAGLHFSATDCEPLYSILR